MRSAAILLAAATLGALAAPFDAAADREANLKRGSCDGLLDYADELNPDRIELLQEVVLGDGMSRIDVSMRLTNADVGRFRSASAFPRIDPGNNPLGVVLDPPPTQADFGAIDPEGERFSETALSLTLPSANVQALIEQLEDGTIPIGVHADEETVYPDGTMIRNWNANGVNGWDDAYRSHPLGGIEIDQEPPFEPGAIYGINFAGDLPPALPPGAVPTYDGQAGDGAGVLVLDDTICAGAIGLPSNVACYDAARGDAPLYITPGDDALYGLPEAVHYVRVLSITAGGGYMRVQRTDTDSIPAIVRSGSFCSGPDQELDPPVSETQHERLDGDPITIEVGSGTNRQVRFNYLPWDHTEVSLSGQIGCHAIKPKLGFRIREGRVRTEAGFETDCNLSAEVRVSSAAEVEEYREPIEMWSQCIRLPSIPIGPGGIPATLQLRHLIDVGASASAGAVVGFSQNWRVGYTVSCEGLGDEPAACTTDSIENPVTTNFTPPQLTDDTNLSIHAKTTLEAALRLGVEYVEIFPVTCELGAGLTLESSVGAEFAVQPTFDPWWKATWGYEVVGGVDLGLYGLGLVDVDVDLVSEERPIADAGGPLIGGALGGANAGGANGGGGGTSGSGGLAAPDDAFVSGADQRWSVAIDDTVQPNGVNVSSIAALPDGSSIALAAESIGGRGRIVKLDRFGAFQWAKRYSLAKKPRKVRALSDGSFVVAGEPSWIARHAADGDLVARFDLDVARPGAVFPFDCLARDVVPIETAPGVYEFVLVGSIGVGAVGGSEDGCALRVAADGSIAWAKVYEAADLQALYGATLLRDGDVAAVGESYVNLVGNRRMPLVVRLDGETGDVLWSRGMPMYRTGRFNAVAEGPDGTLFAAGIAGRTITQTGAALVARIGSNGDDVRHALLFQDFAAEYLLDFETWAPTSGGDSPYDELFDIALQGDGFVVVGRSGLGTATDAWAAKINQKLGVEWFRVFDGGSTDALTGVDVAPDGIFASGWSGSLPEPDGPNTGENQIWVMKLPFTGAVELRPNANVATRYLAGAVRFSSEDPDVATADPGSDLPLTAVDAIVTNAAPDANFVATAANQCVGLLTETGHPSTLDPCAEDSDLDGFGDDVDNCVDVANATQLDGDADGAGNACDGDLDNDGATDAGDVAPLQAAFGTTAADLGWSPAADLNEDGVIGLPDFNALRAFVAAASPEAAPLGAGGPLVEIVFPETMTNEIAVAPGTPITAQVRITAGPEGLSSYGVSLRFDEDLDLAGATELLPAGFDLHLSDGFEVSIESVAGTQGEIRSCEAATLGAGVAEASFVACEIAFVASASVADDGEDLFVGLFATGVDGLFASGGSDLGAAAVFANGSVHPVPEAPALAASIAALLATFAARRMRPRRA